MKALAVFSGGLDSMIAAELIRAQDIDVLALFFETPFFTSGRARQSAAEINLPIKVTDITAEHLEMLKSPKHGYGGNMNPCIDCHTLMIRKAGRMMEEEGAQFCVTGEVLGQRPMSQNRQALSLVEKESGFEGLILRPLSAKSLPPTVPEKEGWVDREALMNITGRSRKPQMALAKKFGITSYPSPAGGCLLTDKVFSRRLKDLFSSRSTFGRRSLELLKVGRHFRLGPDLKLVVGRNKSENAVIRSLSGNRDLLLVTPSVPGPTGLILGETSPEEEDLAAVITVSYSDAAGGRETEVMVSGRGGDRMTTAKGRDKREFKPYMI